MQDAAGIFRVGGLCFLCLERLQKQVIYDLFTKIRAPGAEVVELFGTGDELRDFIHAQDVAQAVEMVHEADLEGAVNVASGREISIRTLAELAVEITNSSHEIRFKGEGRLGDPLRLRADISKISALGFTSPVDLH